MKTYQIELTEDEIAALPEALAWIAENAPAGLPMKPNVREGILILKRLETVREKLAAAAAVAVTKLDAEPVADAETAAE
jgi:hypothetical protein